MQNPYEAYQKQSLLTMTSGEMLLKLYDGVIKQLSAAKIYIGEKNAEKANTALLKAQKMLNYLKDTLDFQYDISHNLSALYDYFVSRIVSANVRKTVEPLDEVLPMIAELRDAFAQAAKQARGA